MALTRDQKIAIATLGVGVVSLVALLFRHGVSPAVIAGGSNATPIELGGSAGGANTGTLQPIAWQVPNDGGGFSFPAITSQPPPAPSDPLAQDLMQGPGSWGCGGCGCGGGSGAAITAPIYVAPSMNPIVAPTPPTAPQIQDTAPVNLFVAPQNSGGYHGLGGRLQGESLYHSVYGENTLDQPMY